MRMELIALILVTSATLVASQRPFFAGSRPIGYPELANKTTTPANDGLVNKFGDEESTTQKLPLEALGDRDLVDRLSKLPIDKQPFWFINWQALEEQRKNPQTYPQRPNSFVESPSFPSNPIPNTNTRFNTNPLISTTTISPPKFNLQTNSPFQNFNFNNGNNKTASPGLNSNLNSQGTDDNNDSQIQNTESKEFILIIITSDDGNKTSYLNSPWKPINDSNKASSESQGLESNAELPPSGSEKLTTAYNDNRPLADVNDENDFA